jgi:hypothetical protein
LNNPILFTYEISPDNPSLISFSGVLYFKKSSFVALLTCASVDCAERTTATRRVYLLTYDKSDWGAGIAFANFEKI